MLRRLLLLFIALALLCGVDAQAGWARRYEAVKSAQRSMIAPLSDGGYAVGVNATPNAIFVVDRRGAVRAALRVEQDEILFLTTGTDGAIFAGVGSSKIESNGPRLLKLRPDLSVAWTRQLTTDGGERVDFSRAAGTRDGGVVVVTHLHAASVVTKLNRRGDVEWATAVDPSDHERIGAVQQTRDGGYVAAGASPRWAWLLKLAADGRLVWQRNYGPKEGWLHSVAETSDGAIVAAGNFGNVPMILKTSGRGDVIWSKTAALPGYGYSLVGAGADVIATITADETMQLLSIRSDGSLRWQRTFHRPILANGFENAMLAAAAGEVAYAPAVDRGPAMAGEPAIFAAPLTTGPDGCAWFSAGSVTLQNVALRDEELMVERSPVKLVARDSTVILSRLKVRAVPETCAAAEPSHPAAPADPKRITQPFRSREDTTAVTRSLAEMLLARKFTELEEAAARMRREPSPDPMRPNRALATFYEAFLDNAAAPVQTRLARLREWSAAHPRSSTARIALAYTLYKAAWDIRGNQTADSVTDTATDMSGKMLAEAREVLDGAGPDAPADPFYWYARIPLTQLLNLGDVGAVGLEALALHPDPEIAFRAADYLTTQWGGSPEIYMRFADQATRVTSARYGQAMYMWLVYQIRNFYSPDDYKQYDVDWKRVQKGAEDLIRLKPEWLPTYHRYAVLARRYDDKETLRALFQRPELEWYEDAERMWLSRERYDVIRESVLPAPRPPAPVPPLPTAVPPALTHAPAILLDTELDLGGTVHNVAAFLVATSRGPVAVSSVPQPRSAAPEPRKSWTVWKPAQPARRMRVTSVTEVTAERRGVALQLEPVPAAARALKAATEPAMFGNPVFLIFCSRTHGRCEEKTVAAKIVGIDHSTAGVLRSYILELHDPPGEDEAQGAALVNERREVLGVVTSRRELAGKVMFGAETIRNLLPGP
jgi:hypothetical protein